MTQWVLYSKFQLEGREFEVRVLAEPGRTAVQAFASEGPVSQRFSVERDTSYDFAETGHGNAVEELVKIVTNEVLAR